VQGGVAGDDQHGLVHSQCGRLAFDRVGPHLNGRVSTGLLDEPVVPAQRPAGCQIRGRKRSID
jgi:hypothetical protein